MPSKWSAMGRSLWRAAFAVAAIAVVLVGGGRPAVAQSVAPEISELARALKHDPDLIYEYVYNNIETIPIYGSLKGPLGALIDGKGTAFDQAELMVQLLQQAALNNSAITNPQYQIGSVWLTQNQLNNWLGVDSGAAGMGFVLGTSRIPTASIKSSGGVVKCVAVTSVWVQVNISGTPYIFDPSAKLSNQQLTDLQGQPTACMGSGSSVAALGYLPTTGVNLATATGYSQATLLSRAQSGATVTSNSVAGLNRSYIRSDLSGFSTSLANWIRTNQPSADTSAILGGRKIVPLTVGLHQRWTALPNLCTSAQVAACGSVATSSTMASTYRTTLSVTVPGASAVVLNSADIYGRRLSVFFDGSNRPVLALDGTTLATGSAVSPGANVALNVTITHPFSGGVQSGQLNVPSGGQYIIANGWGGVGRGMIERHRKQLLVNQQAAPSAPSSEPVMGESISVLANTWMAQVTEAKSIASQIGDVVTYNFHDVGIAGVKTIGSGVGPFVDLPYLLVGMVQRTARPNTSSATPAESSVFFVGGTLASVFESGIIEQTQPGQVAVSTVKLLDTAILNADTIFDINNSAISGNDAALWTSTIKPQFQTYYTGSTGTSDLSRINSLVTSSNLRVIAALHGPQTVNQWQGSGYFQITQAGNSIGSIISGGLSGGFSTSPIAPITVNSNLGTYTPVGEVNLNLTPGTTLSTFSGLSPTKFTTPMSPDPVNLATGSFVSDHDDLTVGAGDAPFSLTFSRHYDSASRLAAVGPLGLGWTHNFAMLAQSDSDGFVGMGAGGPVSGASAIATSYVLFDLLNDGTTALNRILTAVVAERWLMDQLTGNVVNVVQGARGQQFVKLADGSYNAPLHSSDSLSLVSGLYRLTTADQTKLNFNSAGNVANIQWASGPTTTFAYNGSNRLTSVTNGLGRTLTLTYTGAQISTVSDGVRSVGYTYDGSLNLTSFRDPANFNTTYNYDVPGRMTKIFFPSFPSNPFVTNTYNSLDQVSLQKDANQNATSLYLTGTRAEQVDASGGVDVIYLTARGGTAMHIDALSAKTVNTYDGLDRLVSTTFPELNSVNYAYDDAHGPVAQQNVLTTTNVAKPGSGASNLVRSFTYDTTFVSKVKTATDPNGATTTFIYDTAGGTGNLLEIDQPAVGGQTPRTFFTYNNQGQVLNKTDPAGMVTLNAYDASTAVLLSVTDDNVNLQLKTQYGYDALGNVANVTDPNNQVSTMTYDALRRVTQVSGPTSTGAVTKTTYNADGLVTKVERATGNVGAPWQTATATYSFTGQKLSETDANNHTTSYTYDVMNRVAAVTDPVNRVTTFTYDLLGRPISQTNAAIQAAPLVHYGYSTNGLRQTLTDANNNRSTYVYDGQDRLAALRYPSTTRGAGVSNAADADSFTYDANGNVLTRTKRDGAVFTFTYDALNRPLTKQYPGHVDDVYFTYDLAGRVLSLRYGSMTGAGVIYGYDTVGRLTSEATNGQTMAYAYDAASNRTRVTWPDGFYVTYIYDALSRLTSIAENGATTGPGVLATYGYSPLSQRISTTLGNGASTSYTYNAADKLASLAHVMPTAGAAFNQTLTYGYTAADQLQSRTSSNASYDWPGYGTGTTAATADGLNRDSAIAALAGGYDANGDLTNDGSRQFAYDRENRLAGGTISATSVSVVLAYDPAARLRQQQTTIGANPTVTTQYLYAGSQLSAEYDASGALLRRYVHASGVDEPIVWYEGSGVADRRWLHVDERGSIVAWSSLSGAVTVVGYGPYGEPSTWGGSRFAYTGQIQLAEVQLYHYKARAYDPAAGRFMQIDPIGYEGGPNLYEYVSGDPLNLSDPTGKIAFLGQNPQYGNLTGGFTVPSSAGSFQYAANGYNTCMAFGAGSATCGVVAAGNAANSKAVGTGMVALPVAGVALGAAVATIPAAATSSTVPSVTNLTAGTFSASETTALRGLFGNSTSGVKALIQSIESGAFRPPPGITTQLLQRYGAVAERAILAGKDKIGVQVLRLEAIKLLTGN